MPRPPVLFCSTPEVPEDPASEEAESPPIRFTYRVMIDSE